MHVQSKNMAVISRWAAPGARRRLPGRRHARRTFRRLTDRPRRRAGRAHGLCGRGARRPGGRAVLIEGEPGIGKSALVRAACAEAIGLGCQVFWGAGDELGQTFPLLPFLDGLRVRESIPDTQRKTILALLRGETRFRPRRGFACRAHGAIARAGR